MSTDLEFNANGHSIDYGVKGKEVSRMGEKKKGYDVGYAKGIGPKEVVRT